MDNIISNTETFLNTIIENSPISMWISDSKGTLLRTNQACRTILKLTDSDIVGKYNVLKDNIVEAQGFMPQVKEVFEKGLKTRFILHYNTGNVKQLKLETKVNLVLDVTISPVLDDRGKVTNAIIQHLDITQLANTEAALQISLEKWKALYSTLPVGVSILDENGKLSEFNPELGKILCIDEEGMKQGKFRHRKYFSADGKQMSAADYPSVRAVNEQRTIHNVEICVEKEDGEIVWTKVSAAPLNIPGVSCVLATTDITKRKRMEVVIQNYQKLESIGLLAGGIAHNFNNILATIFGYIEMGIMRTYDDRVKYPLNKALSVMNKARGLTGQLLTFARGGDPIRKTGSLFPYLQEITHFTLSGSNIVPHFEIAQDLWMVNYDQNQISQAIECIVTNAKQAMPAGGVIEITAKNVVLSDKEHLTLPGGKYAKISIKDYGTGIPNDVITRIFDPFFTTKTSGQGLGLATCYSIVKRHDGSIDVDSESGIGCTFHIYLPASSEAALSVAESSTLEHHGSGLFLIMDDEEAVREVLGEIVTVLGYTAVLKKNGSDAIDYFAKNRNVFCMLFDITVADGMGGKEAIAEIRKLDKKIPVFVASGYGNDPVMSNPVQYGFTASICKPFNMDELVKMLNKYLIVQ